MDLFNKFATDNEAEIKGVWHPMGDMRLKIARDTNPAYTEAVSSLYEENRLGLEGKGADVDALNLSIMAQAAARGLLLDWDGNVTYKGEKLAYTYDNAVMVLKHPDFLRLVRQKAAEQSHYRLVKEEEQGKT
jgi:hypothetical protein